MVGFQGSSVGIWMKIKVLSNIKFYRKILQISYMKSPNDMWEKMTHEIRKVAKETLGPKVK